VTLTWEELYPLRGLRLRAGDGLELRWLDDDLLLQVAAVAHQGIHDPSWQPLGGWTDAPPLDVARSVTTYAWRARADLRPERWWLQLAVVLDGEVVGLQDVGADDFAVLREVRTGSWLGRRHQGRGTGSRMRLAVLSFAFDHLGALSATTGAWADNGPSNRVSANAGYEADGLAYQVVRGVRREERRYRLTAERWQGLGHPRVEVDGLTDAAREQLGAGGRGVAEGP
jgi:RimJ/RimL family protein N-acetyltransferase